MLTKLSKMPIAPAAKTCGHEDRRVIIVMDILLLTLGRSQSLARVIVGCFHRSSALSRPISSSRRAPPTLLALSRHVGCCHILAFSLTSREETRLQFPFSSTVNNSPFVATLEACNDGRTRGFGRRRARGCPSPCRGSRGASSSSCCCSWRGRSQSAPCLQTKILRAFRIRMEKIRRSAKGTLSY